MKTHRQTMLAYAFASFLSVTTITGCFRVGLPEYIGDPLHGVPRAPRVAGLLHHKLGESTAGATVLVLVGCGSEGGEPSGPGWDASSLGHQYLLGALPLTRVFYQHGVESEVAEILIDELVTGGFTVVRGACTDNEALIRTLRPVWVLSVDVPRFRINGFDLIVTRLLDIDGEVRLRSWPPNGCPRQEAVSVGSAQDGRHEPRESPIWERTLRIEKSEYGRFAHAPDLSELARQALHEAFAKNLPDALTLRRAVRAESCAGLPDESQVIIVRSPDFVTPVPPRLGAVMSGSYGYDRVPPLTEGAIGAVLRRGLRAGMPKGLVSAELINGATRRSPLVWELVTTVEGIGINEDRFGVRLGLDLLPQGSGAALLSRGAAGSSDLRKECTEEQAESTDADGSWIVSAERAAMSIARNFFALPTRIEGEVIDGSSAAGPSGEDGGHAAIPICLDRRR